MPSRALPERDEAEPAPPRDDRLSPRDEAEIAALTDQYFKKTRTAVGRYGDKLATYAVFMRRPVLSAPRLAVRWLERVAAMRGVGFEIEVCHEEGRMVGAGEPLLYITGPLVHLVDVETLYLQLVGPPAVAAFNAYSMCCDLPLVAFLAMDGRHCTGPRMMELMAYGAAVGSEAARREVGAKGFIGNATDETAHYFGNERGMGTMPHALVGYAGSTLAAARMFAETFPDEPMTVLVDYFGCEIDDSLAVCAAFPELAAAGRLAIRLDTHGGRFVQGLDTARSYEVLERHVPKAIRQYRTEAELRLLIGTGVSAAAIHHLRDALDTAGYPQVKIVASSGFGPAKCKVMAIAKAPIDVIGTGSYLPGDWHETYATADIVAYDGKPSVKVGREFLLHPRQA